MHATNKNLTHWHFPNNQHIHWTA